MFNKPGSKLINIPKKIFSITFNFKHNSIGIEYYNAYLMNG